MSCRLLWAGLPRRLDRGGTPAEPNAAGVAGPPDLVVEVLSPRTVRLDEGIKRRVYARSGVKELWLVDPDRRLIRLYRFDEDPEHPVATLSEQETFACSLFPGLEFEGRRVFRQ